MKNTHIHILRATPRPSSSTPDPRPARAVARTPRPAPRAAMSAMSQSEYDALIYPGFLRRNVARWNDDGSAAPLSRARGPKGETFVLQLRSGEIDQDVSAIEAEVRPHRRVIAST